MKTLSITITSTAVVVVAAQNLSQTVYLQPTAQDIYIGGPDVTYLTGTKLTKNVITPVFIARAEALYAVVQTGAHPLTVLSRTN